MESFAVLPEIFDHDTAAANDLSRIALAIDLAKPGPSTEDFGVTDFNQIDLVLGAKGLDELEVFSLRTRLNEDTQMCLTLVQRFSAFTEPTGEAVMNERILQHLLHENVRESTRKKTANQPAEHLQPKAFPWARLQP
jgi:hypothetical protein